MTHRCADAGTQVKRKPKRGKPDQQKLDQDGHDQSSPDKSGHGEGKHDHAEHVRAMLGMACTVLACSDLDEVLSAVTRELRNVLPLDRASIAFLSPNKESLILRDVHEPGGNSGRPHGDGRPVPLEDGTVIGWAALHREAVMRNDIESDERFAAIAGEEPLKSDMIIPLIAGGDLIGTFNIGSDRPGAFETADFERAKHCGQFVCRAIERIMLIEETREYGERCRLLQDSANDMIILVDRNTGKIIEANKKGASMLGCPREEIIGKSYIELFAREELYQARKDFINILSGKADSFSNRRMVNRGGDDVFVDISTSAITVRNKAVIQAVIRDISERRQLEREITAQNQRLQQINRKLRDVDRMKTEFLANISHELRTPLSIILAYSESLRDESISADDRKKFLDVVSENGETLLNLINNLLDLSKLEISGAMLNITLSHVHDVIRSVWPNMETAARAKGLLLSFEPGDGIPVMYFDATQIKKVLSCLIQNAIKFTDAGGSVRVFTSLDGEEVIIKVVDTGMGIPYEAIPHIFAMFHQVDGSSSRRCGGMGIGLALAKHIVGLHKGKLWVESEVGTGSEFTVALPLDTEDALLTGSAAAASRGLPIG